MFIYVSDTDINICDYVRFIIFLKLLSVNVLELVFHKLGIDTSERNMCL